MVTTALGLTGRAAHKIKSETNGQEAEEAAATAHTPLLPRAQHSHHRFAGGPGDSADSSGNGRNMSARAGVRFRDGPDGRQGSGSEGAVEKPADSQRRRQCEVALVETLQGLVCALSWLGSGR